MMQVACALSDHRQAFFCANSDVLVLWAKLLGAQSLEDRVTSREDGGWADQRAGGVRAEARTYLCGD